ncbi:MAG: hypothetical protein WC088_02670, partial [Candidatus Izemoplasmatales bacterium]
GYDPDSAYYTIFNNSDTEHKLIMIIEQDRNSGIDETGWAENSDLFRFGDFFNSNTYTDADWYQDSFGLMNFSISIGMITNRSVSISIVFEE